MFQKKKPTTTLPDIGHLAPAELVFPLKPIATIITGLPESFLPLHGPKTLSRHYCQYPSCSLEFSQKAAACNHICHDYLNVALGACIVVLAIIPKCGGIVPPLGDTTP